VFAIIVLIAFSEAKRELLDRLKAANSYSIYLSESVNRKDVPVRTSQTLREEQAWMEEFGEENITFMIQPHVLFQWKRQNLPIVIYNRSFEELPSYQNDIPQALLLTDHPERMDRRETVSLRDNLLYVKPHAMPEIIKEKLNITQAVGVPYEMAGLLIESGYLVHMIAEFDSVDEVERFAAVTRAYYKAEKRRTRSFSALEILRQIDHLNQMQSLIRRGISIGCGVILALITGALAWMEFRQEVYLNALLRSFGVSRFMLFVHTVVENLIVVGVGVLAAFLVWKKMISQLSGQLSMFRTTNVNALEIPKDDTQAIILFAASGVILAVIPVIFAMRRPPGLVLQ